MFFSSSSCNAGPKAQVNEIDFVQGGLGWKVWGSALILASRLFTLKDEIHGKEILELGSGCGLCGLLLASLGATKVVLTDNVPDVLSNLCRNVSLLSLNLNHKLDIAIESEEQEFDSEDGRHFRDIDYCTDYVYKRTSSEEGTHSCCVKVRMLDWIENEATRLDDSYADTEAANMFPTLNKQEKFDWIVGSDLLYDLKSSLALAKVIQDRLRTYRSKALIVAPIREKDILCHFLEVIRRLGMSAKCEQITNQEWIDCKLSLHGETLDSQDEDGTMRDMDYYEGGITMFHIALTGFH